MSEEDREKADAYAQQRGFSIQEPLGDGLHGSVWKVQRQDGTFSWVVKMHRYLPAWRRELLCYERLQELNISRVAGAKVPQLIRADEEWRAIEMTLVTAPFLLDFATAWLDERPEFVPGAWEEAEAKAAEVFSQDWSRAQAVIQALEAETGIIMGDVHPGNLRLSGY